MYFIMHIPDVTFIYPDLNTFAYSFLFQGILIGGGDGFFGYPAFAGNFPVAQKILVNKIPYVFQVPVP